ncbi:MAG: TolC family protein [Sulfurovum sp.]|nr:MAG: TolC family protein [Sulfurovum sp.]
MVFKKSIISIMLSLSSTSVYLHATDVNHLNNLSLKEALSLMKRDSLELKISKFNEQIKAQEAKIARGYKYGKVDLKVQALRSNDAGNIFGFKLKSREAAFGDFGFSEFDMSGQTNPLPVQPKDLNYPDARNHFQTTLTYAVPIYTGGKLDQYGKITTALEKMSRLDSSKLLNEKVFQTTKTFYDISLVNQYINNLGNIVSNIEELENIVASMREEGFAKEIDQLEVEAKKAEVESMLTKARYNKELAYQYLSFLLNQKVNSIQEINSLAVMPKIVKEEIQDNNLDIQKAKLGLKITDMAIKVEESKFLPTLGAFGEYGSSDNNPLNEFTHKDFYTVGLQLDWNLFNGKIDKYNLEKSKVEKMKVREQVELAKKGIYLKVRKLITEVKSKDAEITNLDTQLNFASKVYENYQERYKEGITSISDVIIKQSKELEVLLKLLTVKNDRNAKVFELTSIINKGVI